MIVLTGGPGGYLAALGSQAGEDFIGVVMLWTNPTPRVAVFALLNTMVLPWDSSWLGGIVVALALAGSIALLRRSVSAVLLLLVAFGPYAIFHLLFQETLTVRYALPLVPAVALLAAVTVAQATPLATTVVTAALAGMALFHGVPAGAGFARTPNPIVGAFTEMKLLAGRPGRTNRWNASPRLDRVAPGPRVGRTPTGIASACAARLRVAGADPHLQGDR